jgi:hypothetical protein
VTPPPAVALTLFMGFLQGNAAAVAGCTAFVLVIVDMMKTEGFGLNVLSALAYEAIKQAYLNFADNTQLYHGGPTNCTSGSDLFCQMQPMLN